MMDFLVFQMCCLRVQRMLLNPTNIDIISTKNAKFRKGSKLENPTRFCCA